MDQNRIEPEEFEDGITFMSTYNDIDWRKEEENFKSVFRTRLKLRLTHTYKPERRVETAPSNTDLNKQINEKPRAKRRRSLNADTGQ